MNGHILNYLAPPPPSPFLAASPLHDLLNQPTSFLARLLYTLLQAIRPPPPGSYPALRVVCISDSHTQTKSIPNGELLIHAGDLANVGNPTEINAQIEWLDSLPHRHKVIIAGNHDAFLDPRSRRTLSKEDQRGNIDWRNVHYLQHSTVTLAFPGRTLKIYGAPHVPHLGGAQHAFQYARGQDAWTETIPSDADVIVTHTPPKWHRDLQAGLGCEWLLKEIRRVRPKLHVCAHVHDDRGLETLWWDSGQDAYERIRERASSEDSYGLLDIRDWVDMAKMVVSAIKAIMWRAVWGGKERSKGTICVNAALIKNSTGKLDNDPIMVKV